VVLAAAEGGADRNGEKRFDRGAGATVEFFMNVRYDGGLELAVVVFVSVVDALGAEADARLVLDVGKDIESHSGADAKFTDAGAQSEDRREVIQRGDPLGVMEVRGDSPAIREGSLGLETHRVFPRFDEVRHI